MSHADELLDARSLIPPGVRAAMPLSAGEARSGREVAVQHERVEVGAVGPYDRPQLVVYANLGEVVGVGERLEHRPLQLPCKIDVA